MKIYTHSDKSFRKQIKELKALLDQRKAQSDINYMEIKELSERMTRARTAAQFAILRYKYDSVKSGENLISTKKMVEEYLYYKESYYAYYNAYLAQCQGAPANQNNLKRKKA